MTDSSDPWQFDQPQNCATFTLCSIVFGGEPILFVLHDADDDGWQFLSGKPVEMADAAVVCLDEIVKHDPTVLEVADLPPGWVAERTTAAGAMASPAERRVNDGNPPRRGARV